MNLSRKLIIAFACVALVAAFVAPAFAEDESSEPGVKVTATGKAKIVKGDEAAAKKQALDAAKRDAVEQVGSQIVSETVVENFELVKDKIISKASGYVDVKKIDESKEGEVLIVKIEAEVRKKAIQEDASMIYHDMGKPRVMVLISTVSKDKEYKTSSAENIVLEYFSKKEFDIIDQATAMKNIKKDEAKLAADGDARAAAKIGNSAGAEVIVIGTADASEPELILGEIWFSQGRINLRAIKTDNASIYGVVNKTEKVQHGSKDAAEQKAIEKVSQGAGKDIFWNIVKKWNDEKINGIKIELQITGITFEQYEKVLDGLKKIKGVKDVLERDFSEPTAIVDVTFVGTSKELRDQVKEASFGGVKLQVKGATGNKLQFKVGGGK
jgi:hypothetical protein